MGEYGGQNAHSKTECFIHVVPPPSPTQPPFQNTTFNPPPPNIQPWACFRHKNYSTVI